MGVKKMVPLLILTSEIVRKFWNKKVKKENKVVLSDSTIDDFLTTQLKNSTTPSKAVIELRTRLLKAIGEGEKIPENDGNEKNSTTSTTQKTNVEMLKDFLIKNSMENGNLPGTQEIINGTKLTKVQIRIAKTKLLETGELYKENDRVLKLNTDLIRKK